jgi:hypothetical protein
MVPRSPSSASPAFWGKSRAGKNVVRQVTAKNRYARALEAVTDWCRRNRHQPIPDQSAHLTAMIGATRSPGGTPRFEHTSNPFHLSRCEAISFANLKTFVPSLPFDRDFFFGAIDSFHFRVFGRSYTWWNWLAFQEHCEHVLASSSVSHGAAALMR